MANAMGKSQSQKIKRYISPEMTESQISSVSWYLTSCSNGGFTLIKTASNDVDHTRIRRALSHAFSEASLREQEPLMNVYFDLLIQKLYEQIDSPSNGKVNIVRFFNFTTFDLIGDLCFAESFDALRTQEYNSWIANIFKGLKFARLFRVMRAYPLVGMPILAMLALFPGLQKARQRHIQYTQDKTARRLDTVTDRRDFMRFVAPYAQMISRVLIPAKQLYSSS